MMGQLDKAPIPPHAITCWATDHDIIVLLPMTNGTQPYMLKLPLSEGGLSAALEMLKRRRHEVLSPTEAKVFDPPRHQPQVKLGKIRDKLYSETTEAQRENARRFLAKMGIKS